MLLYTARCVLPVSSPPIADGAVVVDDGRIVAVGPRADLVAAHDDAEMRDLGDAVVLPGLVNAHTHLELSWMGEDPPKTGGYVGWLRDFVALRDAADEERAWQAAEAAVEGIVARGTVAVGDISNEIWAASILARSGLHAVAFHELFGFPADLAERLMAEAVGRLETMAADSDVIDAGDRLRVVLTPHALHSTSVPLVKALAGRAVATGDPLSVHLAESSAEVEFLRDGSGPFREFLIDRSVWDERWHAPNHSAVEQLDRLGGLTPRTLATHCVHVNQQDLSLLQSRGATVVTCPRSNRALGGAVAPVPRMLGSGIPVALGTDSLATAPDLDLFAEMAALRREHETLAPAAVVRMATLNGAVALGFGDRLGSIVPDKLAKLAVVPLPDPGDDPLEVVTSGPEIVHRLEDAPGVAA